MAYKRIFVSFDYDHDRHYRYLLDAWNANRNFPVRFSDHTPNEIQSDNVDRVKAVLTRKLQEAGRTLVISGRYANSLHPDWAEIGTRNWQWWEAEKSLELGNTIILVCLHLNYDVIAPLFGKRIHAYIVGWQRDKIAEAIRTA